MKIKSILYFELLFAVFFYSCVKKEKNDEVPRFCEENISYCVYLYNNSISYYFPTNTDLVDIDSIYSCYKELLKRANENWMFEYIRIEANLSEEDVLFIKKIIRINTAVLNKSTIVEEKSDNSIVFRILSPN